MPTYEYECATCGHRLEQFQGINDSSLEVCPECDGGLRRLFSGGAGVISRDRVSGKDRLSRCGHGAPCCGRDNPCESPSCSH